MATETASITIDADRARLAEVRAFVRANLRAVGAGEDAVGDVVQAVDEAVTNVISHGYRGHPGRVAVQLVRAARRVVVTIEDDAPTFDPTAVPEPDLDIPLARLRPGGMGVHLIRGAVDEVRHRPGARGGNVLTLTRTLERGPHEEAT